MPRKWPARREILPIVAVPGLVQTVRAEGGAFARALSCRADVRHPLRPHSAQDPLFGLLGQGARFVRLTRGGGVPQIRVLGGTFSVTDSDGRVHEPRGKAAKLPALLVSQAKSPASVNDIIRAVWPEAYDPELVGRKRGEQVVREVRELFKPGGRAVIPPRRYDRYRLVADAETLWIDALEFDRSAHRACPVAAAHGRAARRDVP